MVQATISRKMSLGRFRWVMPTVAWLFALSAVQKTIGYEFGSSLSTVLEVILFSLLMLAARPQPRAILGSMVIFLVLVLYYLLLAFERDIFAVSDYIRSVKPWLYLALFVLVGRKFSFESKQVRNYAIILIVTVFVAYLAQFVLGGVHRPSVFLEGNFEVPFIVTVWIGLLIRRELRFAHWVSALVLGIVLLSQSRSGAAAYSLTVLAYVWLFVENLNRRQRILGLLLVALTFVGLWLFVEAVFRARLGVGGIEEIDRFRFFLAFWSVFSEGSAHHYLTGFGPLSELPADVCADLSYYYETLAGVYGECYSIIWHAFIMRFIYDFGFLGLLVLIISLAGVVRRRYTIKESIFILIPSIAAGLSVGGLYNVFSFFGLLVVFMSRVEVNKSRKFIYRAPEKIETRSF